MAKGKRATALFEVIQAAKAREEKRLHKSKPTGSGWGNRGLPTPGWWFKNKKSNSSAIQSENDPTIAVRPHIAPHVAPPEPIVSREIPAEAPPQIPMSPIAKEAKRFKGANLRWIEFLEPCT